jgi:short-subunit dehydrogenase
MGWSQSGEAGTCTQTLEPIGKVHTFRCDINCKNDLNRLIRHVDDEMKEVKYLVNAAGVFSPKPFLEHTAEDYDAYVELNRAILFVTQMRLSLRRFGETSPLRCRTSTVRILTHVEL